MGRDRAYDHARQRALERYRASLLPEELERMAVEIEHGRSTFVRDCWGNRQIHLVHCPKANQHIPVVFDPYATNRIVTVLPEESHQFGTLPRPKPKRFREVDPDDFPVEVSAPAVGDIITESGPNNLLAEALQKALEDAGLTQVLAQNSPSSG